MSERTRLKLGAYFLFALVLLSLPTALLVVHLDSQSRATRWVAQADGLRLADSAGREKGLAFAMKTYGLSRDGAERLVSRLERETGRRLGADHALPYGTVLDHYTVDGTRGQATATYDGSAVVMPKDAPQAAAYFAAAQEYAQLKKQPTFLESLTCARLALWDETRRRLIGFRELRLAAC